MRIDVEVKGIVPLLSNRCIEEDIDKERKIRKKAENKMKIYYKLAKPDGWDFMTGKTINYRENIGKTVRVPNYREMPPNLCSNTVLHASLNPNDAFVGSKIPCSVYIVSGKPVVEDKTKSGFRSLHILNEISQDQLDSLFGWKYLEAINPVDPLKIKSGVVGIQEIQWLKQWDSVRDSVRGSVWDSVWDSVRAYIGSLFPNIKIWKYAPKNIQGYPYQSAVNLWQNGLVPSFDGTTWRLHTGLDARICYEITKEKLMKFK